MAKRSTKAELNSRIHELYEGICKGKVTSTLVRFATEKWGVNRRQAEEYIARARELLAEQFRKRQPKFLTELLAKMEAVFQKAFHDGVACSAADGRLYQREDLATARQCIMDMAKLSGLCVDTEKQADTKVPTIGVLLDQTIRANSVEINRLNAKAIKTGLTSAEHKSLIALNRSILELVEQYRRVKDRGDESNMSDEELLKAVPDAMASLKQNLKGQVPN